MKITRVKAIRKKCLDCSDTIADVRNCEFIDCQLYPFRIGKRPKGHQPYKAIKQYCRDYCMLGNSNEVKECPSENCTLHQYRK